MADETTNAPVAGAEETATQDEKKMYVYYYSDPDGATKALRFHPIYSEIPFTTLPWHVHEEAPDASLVDPVWNDQLNGGLGGWQENSGEAQSQIIAQVQEKLQEVDTKSKELDEKAKQFDAENTKLDEAVKTVQSSQMQGTQQNAALLKAFTTQSKQITEMISTMQENMALMQKSQQTILTEINKLKAQPTTPSTGEDTKPADQDKANNQYQEVTDYDF